MPPPITKLRSAYIKHDRVQLHPVGASRTKQSFREETEINNIVAQYRATGLIEHVNKHGPKYGEMPSHDDFKEAMDVVTSSRSMFNELPAGMRNRFGNDPAQFLDFVGDDKNRDEMIEMGLISPEPDLVGDGTPPAGETVPEIPEPPPEAP